MKKLTSIILSLCLAATGGLAFARDSTSMDKGAMSKDSMSKDAMSRETTAKGSMEKMKPMKAHNRKEDMKDGAMKMNAPMAKDKGM